MFGEPAAGDSLDIGFGTLDDPGEMRLSAHIWCAEARLPLPEDGVPKYPRGEPG